MHKRKILLALARFFTHLICFIYTTAAFAEVIILKSGEKIEKQIIEKADSYIKVDFHGAPLTFYLDEIESIDGMAIVEVPVAVSEKEDADQIFKPLRLTQIKDKMVLALSEIKNYAFQESTSSKTIIEPGKESQPTEALTLIVSEGIIDAENKKAHLKTQMNSPFSGADPSSFLELLPSTREAYIEKGMIYQFANGEWNKYPAVKQEDYFKLLISQLELMRASEIEVIERDPLHIKLVVNKAMIVEQALDKIFSQNPEIKEQIEVNYDAALKKADIEFWLDSKFRITKINSDMVIQLDEDSFKPKGSEIPKLPSIIRLEVSNAIAFAGYNQQPEILVPAEAFAAPSPFESFSERPGFFSESQDQELEQRREKTAIPQ